MPSSTSLLVTLVGLLMGCNGNARNPSAFTLNIEELRQINPQTTAGLTYEEDDGAILVTVIDKYGDGHIHQLVLGDVTRAEALDLLARKQEEFKNGR